MERALKSTEKVIIILNGPYCRQEHHYSQKSFPIGAVLLLMPAAIVEWHEC